MKIENFEKAKEIKEKIGEHYFGEINKKPNAKLTKVSFSFRQGTSRRKTT